ncbi:15778_t:CDS:2, partial [Funneliformis geosporum]
KHFKPCSNDYLFLTRKGSKLKDVQVRTIIKRKVERAGIIKAITPHTFRRSLATNLYNKGGKLETIQKQLGHSNIQTTLGYIHNDFNTLYKDYTLDPSGTGTTGICLINGSQITFKEFK